jgi:hypothetical protein
VVPLGEAMGDLSCGVEALCDLSRGGEALGDLSRTVEALGDLSRGGEALGDLSRTVEALGDLSRGGEALGDLPRSGDNILRISDRSEPSNRLVTGPYMPKLAKCVVSFRWSEIEINF